MARLVGDGTAQMFVRTAGLVDMHDVADRLVFVLPTKAQNRVTLGGNTFPVVSCDHRGELPMDANIPMYDVDAQIETIAISKNADWDVFDCFQTKHDYTMPATVDCIIYFITGRICQQLLKFVQCCICKQAVTANKNNYNAKEKFSDELLTSFVQSNIGFSNFIKKLENLFVQHCHKLDVVDAVLSNSIESNILIFPCQNHKIDTISYLVHYYLEIRLALYCRTLNDDKKDNQHVKKISKCYKT
uniref:uncharacterized protein LOC117608882 n=1 Tax=Osmia lignaria TaxID=473952 RepID=UPI0014784EBB|nr:uncharacterized protein LOC117608882 [Osmia lignaria]